MTSQGSSNDLPDSSDSFPSSAHVIIQPSDVSTTVSEGVEQNSDKPLGSSEGCLPASEHITQALENSSPLVSEEGTQTLEHSVDCSESSLRAPEDATQLLDKSTSTLSSKHATRLSQDSTATTESSKSSPDDSSQNSRNSPATSLYNSESFETSPISSPNASQALDKAPLNALARSFNPNGQCGKTTAGGQVDGSGLSTPPAAGDNDENSRSTVLGPIGLRTYNGFFANQQVEDHFMATAGHDEPLWSPWSSESSSGATNIQPLASVAATAVPFTRRRLIDTPNGPKRASTAPIFHWNLKNGNVWEHDVSDEARLLKEQRQKSFRNLQISISRRSPR